MRDLVKGSKRYFYAVTKLVNEGESLLGKIAQSTILRSYNMDMDMMQMNPAQKVTDYIVEERIMEPRLFIMFGEITVPWETIWNIKS